MWHLVVCLGALAIGLWPGAVVAEYGAPNSVPLPVLQCLAVAQVGFILLVYPLILMRRSLRDSEKSKKLCPLQMAIESFVMMLTAAPLYVIGTYLSDGVFADAVRLWLYLAGIFPLGWLAGMHLARGWRIGAMLGAVLIALGLPAGFYIAAEFAPSAAIVMRRIAPAIFAWDVASPRGPTYWPDPLWAWFIWPGVAILATAALWTINRHNSCRRAGDG